MRAGLEREERSAEASLERHRRLHEIARIATSPLEAEALLHLAVEKVLVLTRSEVACLLLEGERGLVERVAWGLDLATLRAVEGERDPVDRVVLDDLAVVVPEVEGPRLRLPNGREVHLRGLLGVPLRHGGRPLGALFVGNPERPYGDEDRELLEAAADILALASTTARHVGRAAAEAEEVAALADLGRLVAAAPDADAALRYVVHAAEALLSLERFAVLRLPPAGPPETLAGAAPPLEDLGRRAASAVEAALAGGDALPFRPHLVDADGHRKGLYAAPVAGAGDSPVLLLGVGAAVETAEYDRRVRLLHLVAGQAAVALARRPGAPSAASPSRDEAAAPPNERLAALGALAAGIAHEVKNPLTAIKGFAELLPSRAGDPAFVRRFAEVVLAEVARLDRLVGDLLALARPAPPAERPADVGRVVEGVAGLVGPEAAADRIEVSVEAATGLAVRADPDALRRAVLNLARNALEAMRGAGGGRLTLRAGRDGADVLVEVRDTGPGIPPAVRERLFEPFVSGRPGGTGLGLAITARIVETAGGRIEARSTPGEGAVFLVRLPAAA